MSELSRTETTFRFERFRAVSAGVIETAGSTFLLLIAVVWFEAGATAKGLLASGTSIGLLLTPVTVSVVAQRQWRAGRAAACLLGLGSLTFLIAACLPVLPAFLICGIVAMASSSAVLPMLTQIYQNNYPSAQRGRLFSRTFIIRIATTIVFAKLAGDFLSERMEWFRFLLVAFALAFAGGAFCLWRVPSVPLLNVGGRHPFRALRFVRSDALFRRTLTSWMILGFANLMMLPLRVEYLANPKYNLALAAATIALLTEVVPNLTRLVMSQVWGMLFDRINFFMLRAILNIGFAIGILSFFVGDSFAGLVAGSAGYGIARAGGDVAWSLWVTKLAPADHVADYMSVHTFFTGIRGVIAPTFAFHMAHFFELKTMGIVSAVLIAIATLMLVPEIHFGKKRREGQVLVEEVSE